MRRRKRWVRLGVTAGLVSCALIGAEDRASAQTAVIPVIVQSESGLCLAVAPRPSNRSPSVPTRGWPVVVEPCTGTRAQRFGQIIGDYDDFQYEAGLCLGQVAGSSLVELAYCQTDRPVLESGGLHTDGARISLRLGQADLCLTAPAAGSGSTRVTIRACGSQPGQSWTISRTP